MNCRTSLCSMAFVAIFSAAAPAPASADAIVLSGTVTVAHPAFGNAGFSLSGDGFSLSGVLDDGGNAVCLPCGSGAHEMSIHYGGDMGRASGTVAGVTYSNLWLGGRFALSGVAVLPVSSPPEFSLTFPFSIVPGSGWIIGFTDSQREHPVFSVMLAGNGIATAVFRRPDCCGDPAYTTQSVTFEFGSPSPTPEPATVFLLAAGLAFVARATRNRFVAND